MVKQFIFSVTILFSSIVFSQPTNPNEITSEGNAKMKIKPDVALFDITVQKENEIEKNAIKDLNEEVEKLQQLLFKLGFTSSNIKISGYKVSNDSRYSNNNKKNFVASNSLKLQFNINNKVINDFYQELQNGNFTDLEIEFDSQLSDELEKESRKKLIKLAIADAKSNAENIANALNLNLGNVKHVSKGYNEVYAAYSKNLGSVDIKADKEMALPGPKSSFDKFEVEEKELEEKITIIYEIVKK